MAVVNINNTVGYLGEIFLVGRRPNAMLRLTGRFGARTIGREGFAYSQTTSREFPTGVFYSLAAPAQPAVLEGANAPTANNTTVTQSTNVVQIFHEAVSTTYLAQSDKTIAGVVPIPQGEQNGPVQNPRNMDFQVIKTLEKMAQDLNTTLLKGAYANPANPATTALRTRGLITALTTNVIDSSADAVSGDPAAQYRGYVEALLSAMIAQNGYSIDETFVCFVDVAQFRNITRAYAKSATQFVLPGANIAGLQLRQIVTAFGTLILALEPDMPANKFVIADMMSLGIVGLEVPGKGVLFEEPLFKQGSADQTQIYGQIGLDHGPEWMHGILTVPSALVVSA